MTSVIASYAADLIEQIITPATSLAGAAYSAERDVGNYPYGFIQVEPGDYEADCQSIMDRTDTVTIYVVGRTAESVITVLEELAEVLLPYTSANAMYAHGVFSVFPKSIGFDQPQAVEAGQGYKGEIVFEFRVRTVYS